MTWGLRVAGALYLTLVTMAVCVALFSSDAERRTDARLTLRLLLWTGGGAGGVGSVLLGLSNLHELGML